MLYTIRKLYKNTVKCHIFHLFIFIKSAVASFWMCGSLLFFDVFWQIQAPRFRKQIGIFVQKLRFLLVYIKTNFIQIFIKIWDGDLKFIFKLCWFDTKWPYSVWHHGNQNRVLILIVLKILSWNIVSLLFWKVTDFNELKNNLHK